MVFSLVYCHPVRWRYYFYPQGGGLTVAVKGNVAPPPGRINYLNRIVASGVIMASEGIVASSVFAYGLAGNCRLLKLTQAMFTFTKLLPVGVCVGKIRLLHNCCWINCYVWDRI